MEYFIFFQSLSSLPKISPYRHITSANIQINIEKKKFIKDFLATAMKHAFLLAHHKGTNNFLSGQIIRPL